MAVKGGKPDQQNKLLREQLHEERTRVERQVKEEHKRWCALIAERRSEANLTIHQLAEIAGIHERTIRNIEHGSCKSIAQATLNRLRSVRQLRLPITLDSDSEESALGFQAIWLPNYDPNYCAELLQSSIRWRKNKLPYLSLHPSKTSTERYQSLISSGAYGDYINQTRNDVLRLISYIDQLSSGPFDVICLTIGHGWSELHLAQALLQAEKYLVGNIWLISPNIHLLSHGLHVYNTRLQIPQKRRNVIGIVMGRHEDYLKSMPSISTRQKVFLVFGTLVNHDYCRELLTLISLKANNGDILVFDTNFPFHGSGTKKDILDNDPRLSGRLPLSYVQSLEGIYDPSIREFDSSILMVDWSYSIEDSKHEKGNNLESYSVDMRARVFREHSDVQDVSILRIHRHSPELLDRYLASYQWSLVGSFVQGQVPEINYPSKILVFVKH